MDKKDQPAYHSIRLAEGARMPVKGYQQSVGYDCFAYREVRIPRGETAAVPLGFQMKPAFGQFARLDETSSWPFQKPGLIMRSGVLDPDYKGQIAALFTNVGDDDFVYVDKGERCAQIIFSCFRCAPWHSIASLDQSDRGTSAGFVKHLVPGPHGGIPVNARPVSVKRGRGDGGQDQQSPRDETHWRNRLGQTEAEAGTISVTEGSIQGEPGSGENEAGESMSVSHTPPNATVHDRNPNA